MQEVYRALADPTRREILRLLRDRDMTAGEISRHFPQARSTLSEHLAVLRRAGLVQVERRGQQRIYSLNLSVLEEALMELLRIFRVGEKANEGG